jgi:cell wall-associated NlpC family hydrolase
MLSIVSAISVNLIIGANPAPHSGTTPAARPVAGIAATAARYLGTRYRLGGVKPGAFDCSGFMRYVFARHGVALPRTAREQATVGHRVIVGLDSLRVGDLLFFRTPRGRASHVAMYAGDGRIIHASSGSHRIRYDDLASARGRWFVEHLSSVRRVLDSTGPDGQDTVATSSRSEVDLLRSLMRAGE